jgi:hypothetical protein
MLGTAFVVLESSAWQSVEVSSEAPLLVVARPELGLSLLASEQRIHRRRC